MRQPLASVAFFLAIAIAFSAFPSPSQALPAPEPSNSDLSVGLAQWGAETEDQPALSQDDILAVLLELARPEATETSKAAMCETLAAAAQAHELPVGFFVRLINQESGFDPASVSSAGAQGVAQFMPSVAKEWGLSNPFDPHAALMASARFLRSLYNQFGNWGLAAAAYNGGMGRIQKWIEKRGKLPDETRHYVLTITGVPAEKWVGAKGQLTKFSIPPRAPCQEIAHLADPVSETESLLSARMQVVAGPPSKTATAVAAVAARGGIKMAVIKVKGASKVAAAKGKIAEPKSIVADAADTKSKRGKTAAAVKLAEKPAAKSQAKAKDTKDGKKTKGRIQVADARGARK